MSGQQEQAVQCPSLHRARGKAAWKSAAIFKPYFLFPGNDLQVLRLVWEAVLKLTWFSPLTACWVNSKPTCSSSCSGISHIWWTFSVLYSIVMNVWQARPFIRQPTLLAFCPEYCCNTICDWLSLYHALLHKGKRPLFLINLRWLAAICLTVSILCVYVWEREGEREADLNIT